MKILVVDDEDLARQKIVRFLSESKTLFEIREASNGLQALEMAAKFQPDLIFLDIEMPGLNGLQVLQNLENRSAKIIFQTAYDEYAIKAFEENACDYLLKPFSAERFHKSFAKALQSIQNENVLQKIEDTLSSQYLEKICVKQGTRVKIISLSDVLCFLSKDHYTFVCTAEGESICDLSLTHIAERIDPAKFKRVHRHAIIAVDSIAAIKNGDNMQVQLKNGLSLPVSRSSRKIIKEILV